MDQVILVGQVASKLERVSFEEHNPIWLINLQVTNYEDTEKGQVEMIPIVLPAKIVMIGQEHIGLGRTIGVKGFLQTNHSTITVNVEKLFFIETTETSNL